MLPLDFWLNHRAIADAALCGVPFARLQEWVLLVGIGELNEHADAHVRDSLLRVLRQMDELDSEFVIEMVILAGDLSAAYDAFHSQNRNARTGMGIFCSREMGLVLLLKVID